MSFIPFGTLVWDNTYSDSCTPENLVKDDYTTVPKYKYDGNDKKEVVIVHCLETGGWLFSNPYIKNYVVTFEGDKNKYKISEKQIQNFSNGAEIANSGKEALNSYNIWSSKGDWCNKDGYNWIRYPEVKMFKLFKLAEALQPPPPGATVRRVY